MLKGEAYDGKAVDVWSCGCSLYILLCGDYPFRTAGHHQAATPIKRMQAMFPKLCAGDYNPLRPEVPAQPCYSLLVTICRRRPFTCIQAFLMSQLTRGRISHIYMFCYVTS